MKIVINKKNLIPNSDWLFFRKVRSIIENNNGEFVISIEGAVPIFPGGKCEGNEDEFSAIQREVLEETGINVDKTNFKKILEIETYYDDFYDYRSNSLKPRHTITSYFYLKTDKNIDKQNLELTEQELAQGFTIKFIKKNKLISFLEKDHSKARNGKFFDEENKLIIEKFLNK